MGHVKPSPQIGFSTYLEALAPTTPIDLSGLFDSDNTKTPRLIYNREKKLVEGDLTGNKSKQIHLEKIYKKVLQFLEENPQTHVSDMDKIHLHTLKGMITNQTDAYKQKHSGTWGKIVLLWRWLFRGDIDKLSQKLMNKLDLLETLKSPHRNLHINYTKLLDLEASKDNLGEAQIADIDEKIQKLKNKQAIKIAAELNYRRLEFKKFQTSSAESIQAASINIKILIKLCDKEGVNCSHPLFNDRNKLKEYDDLFSDLSTSAHNIQYYIEQALNQNTDSAKSTSLAEIYNTDFFAAYVKKATSAERAYKNLKDFIPALANENIFDENDTQGLDEYGQAKAEPEKGFIYSPNDRIKGTVAACYAVPMQNIMRHAILMEALEQATPYEASEYTRVVAGAIEAKRSANAMNFK